MTPQIKQRIEQIRRGEVPEGYKKTKSGIVPNEWVEDNLGRYLSEYKKLSNDIEKYPVYSSSRQGLIPQSLYYDNREAVETSVGYKIVPTGYVTYRHMSDDDIFHFNVNRTGGKILVSSEYPVFTANDKGDLGYIVTMLNDTARFRYFCRTQKLGGTRTRLYYKNLCTYRTAFPTYPEQKKIADILSAQDKLIELQQKEIEELKNLKKAYLSKMFPKKGCNVPEIRFPGFTDPWEQRKLGDIGKARSGVGFPDAEQGGVIGVPFFKVSDMNLDGNENEMTAANNYVTAEQIANHRWSPITELPAVFFAKVGAAVMLNRKRLCRFPFLLDNNTMAYSLSPMKWDADFAKALFGTVDLTSLVQVGALPSYNAGDVESMKIYLPSLLEQEQIGAFFKQLDHLITLHQRKLEEMKIYKKSLMQLLLTGIVRM